MQYKNIPHKNSIVLSKLIQIDESSTQKLGNLYFAKVLGKGATHQQAMDFARSRGVEPTVADIEKLSGADILIMVKEILPFNEDDFFASNKNYNWAWLKDTNPLFEKGNVPTFFRFVDGQGSGTGTTETEHYKKEVDGFTFHATLTVSKPGWRPASWVVWKASSKATKKQIAQLRKPLEGDTQPKKQNIEVGMFGL